MILAWHYFLLDPNHILQFRPLEGNSKDFLFCKEMCSSHELVFLGTLSGFQTVIEEVH